MSSSSRRSVDGASDGYDSSSRKMRSTAGTSTTVFALPLGPPRKGSLFTPMAIPVAIRNEMIVKSWARSLRANGARDYHDDVGTSEEKALSRAQILHSGIKNRSSSIYYQSVSPGGRDFSVSIAAATSPFPGYAHFVNSQAPAILPAAIPPLAKTAILSAIPPLAKTKKNTAENPDSTRNEIENLDPLLILAGLAQGREGHGGDVGGTEAVAGSRDQAEAEANGQMQVLVEGGEMSALASFPAQSSFERAVFSAPRSSVAPSSSSSSSSANSHFATVGELSSSTATAGELSSSTATVGELSSSTAAVGELSSPTLVASIGAISSAYSATTIAASSKRNSDAIITTQEAGNEGGSFSDMHVNAVVGHTPFTSTLIDMPSQSNDVVAISKSHTGVSMSINDHEMGGSGGQQLQRQRQEQQQQLTDLEGDSGSMQKHSHRAPPPPPPSTQRTETDHPIAPTRTPPALPVEEQGAPYAVSATVAKMHEDAAMSSSSSFSSPSSQVLPVLPSEALLRSDKSAAAVTGSTSIDENVIESSVENTISIRTISSESRASASSSFPSTSSSSSSSSSNMSASSGVADSHEPLNTRAMLPRPICPPLRPLRVSGRPLIPPPAAAAATAAARSKEISDGGDGGEGVGKRDENLASDNASSSIASENVAAVSAAAATGAAHSVKGKLLEVSEKGLESSAHSTSSANVESISAHSTSSASALLSVALPTTASLLMTESVRDCNANSSSSIDTPLVFTDAIDHQSSSSTGRLASSASSTTDMLKASASLSSSSSHLMQGAAAAILLITPLPPPLPPSVADTSPPPPPPSVAETAPPPFAQSTSVPPPFAQSTSVPPPARPLSTAAAEALSELVYQAEKTKKLLSSIREGLPFADFPPYSATRTGIDESEGNRDGKGSAFTPAESFGRVSEKEKDEPIAFPFLKTISPLSASTTRYRAVAPGETDEDGGLNLHSYLNLSGHNNNNNNNSSSSSSTSNQYSFNSSAKAPYSSSSNSPAFYQSQRQQKARLGGLWPKNTLDRLEATVTSVLVSSEATLQYTSPKKSPVPSSDPRSFFSHPPPFYRDATSPSTTTASGRGRGSVALDHPGSPELRADDSRSLLRAQEQIGSRESISVPLHPPPPPPPSAAAAASSLGYLNQHYPSILSQQHHAQRGHSVHFSTPVSAASSLSTAPSAAYIYPRGGIYPNPAPHLPQFHSQLNGTGHLPYPSSSAYATPQPCASQVIHTATASAPQTHLRQFNDSVGRFLSSSTNSTLAMIEAARASGSVKDALVLPSWGGQAYQHLSSSSSFSIQQQQQQQHQDVRLRGGKEAALQHSVTSSSSSSSSSSPSKLILAKMHLAESEAVAAREREQQVEKLLLSSPLRSSSQERATEESDLARSLRAMSTAVATASFGVNHRSRLRSPEPMEEKCATAARYILPVAPLPPPPTPLQLLATMPIEQWPTIAASVSAPRKR